MKLKTSGRVNYSPTEQVVFDLLPFGQKNAINADDLIPRVYLPGERPFNAQGSVSAALRSLARKIEHNEEPFRLCRSQQAGPRQIAWWLERRG